MQERRLLERTWLYESAMVTFGGRARSSRCYVRDLSSEGAGIFLLRLKFIPTEFELSVDVLQTTTHCQMIWRSGVFVGVRFDARELKYDSARG